MAQGAEGAQLWQCDDWQHGRLPASHAWAGSTAAPPPRGASGMLHAELASPLDCSPPTSCMSHAPPRLLCSSPPALISTAALLPASPTARPLGMGFPTQLRHFGYTTQFGGRQDDAAGAQPQAAAAAAPADEHPDIPAPDAAEPQGITMRSVSMPSIGSPATGGSSDGTGGRVESRSKKLPSSRRVADGRTAEGQPSPHSAPAQDASGDTSKDSSDTPKAKNSRRSCSMDAPSEVPATSSGCGDTDPLDQVAQLHAQLLTPKHLRKGKGGRQPALDPRRDPSVHPAKAKRILANRLSAAKSKMKAKSQTEVLKSRLEQLQKQRKEIREELGTLSDAFHSTTLDNQTLHQQIETLHEHRHNQEVLHQQLCARRDLLLAAQRGGCLAPGLAVTLEHGSASVPAWTDTLERGGIPPNPPPGPTAARPGAFSSPLLCTSSPVAAPSSSPLSDGSADIIAPTPPPMPPPPQPSSQQTVFGGAACHTGASLMQQEPQHSPQHGFGQGGCLGQVPYLPGNNAEGGGWQLTASDISSTFPGKHAHASQGDLHIAAAGRSMQPSALGAAAAGVSEAPLPLFSGGLQPTGSGALQFGSGSLDTLLGAPLFCSTVPMQQQQQQQQQQPFSLPPLPLPPLHNRAIDEPGNGAAVRFAGSSGHLGGGFGSGTGFGGGAGGGNHFQQPWPAATAGNPFADCATLMEQDNYDASNESEVARSRLPF